MADAPTNTPVPASPTSMAAATASQPVADPPPSATAQVPPPPPFPQGFSYQIISADTYDTATYQGIVKRVYWQLVYKSGPTVAVHGGILLFDDEPGDIPDFIPLNSLTTAMVIAWIEAQPNIADIKATLQADVAAKQKYTNSAPGFVGSGLPPTAS